MKQQLIQAFTFTYKETAKAAIAPVRSVKCEGVRSSDGMVALETPDKQWHIYNDIDAMIGDFAKHGKGTIRVIASSKSDGGEEA